MKKLHELLNQLHEIGYLLEDAEVKKQIAVDLLLSKNDTIEMSDIIDAYEDNRKPRQKKSFYEHYLKKRLALVFYVGGEITPLGVTLLKKGLKRANKLALLEDTLTDLDSATLLYETALQEQTDKEIFEINIDPEKLWRDRDLEIELNKITKYIEEKVSQMPLIDSLCVSTDDLYRLHLSNNHLANQNMDYATYIQEISATIAQNYNAISLFVIGHGTPQGEIYCQKFGNYSPLEVINALNIEVEIVDNYIPLQCYPKAAVELALQQGLLTSGPEIDGKVSAEELMDFINRKLNNLLII